jgi:hypothetical protein
MIGAIATQPRKPNRVATLLAAWEEYKDFRVFEVALSGKTRLQWK